MKVIIASSDRNRIEERVAVYSLLQCGHVADNVNVIDGETGNIYNAMRDSIICETGIGNVGNSTSFTMARLYLPTFYDEDQIVIIDSDVIVYENLGGIFGENPRDGIYVRSAYSSGEWATSVMGWQLTSEVKKGMNDYKSLIENDSFSWREKIYLQKRFADALGIQINKINKNWNSFDAIRKNTKVAHFTNLRTQPWKKANHPCEYQWFSIAQKAMAAGFLSAQDIEIQSEYGELRDDFSEKLHSCLDKPSILNNLYSHVEMFYRNLKFHTPLKYLYSEIMP